MFLVNDLIITEDHNKYVDHISGNLFPFFYQVTTPTKEAVDAHQFCHTLMNRNPQNKCIEGDINSDFYDFSIWIFNSFCVANDIKYSVILRAAINVTFYMESAKVEIHRDHEFEHNVFICYLNDTQGATNIYDKHNRIIHSVDPKKFRGLVFSGENHNHDSCKPDSRRVVLVITFK